MGKQRLTDVGLGFVEDDGFDAAESGLWLPKHGIRGPNRRRLERRRFLPGYPAGYYRLGWCTVCIPETVAPEYLVSISGLANKVGETCQDCPDLNDDYLLTADFAIGDAHERAYCSWSYVFGGSPSCSAVFVELELRCSFEECTCSSQFRSMAVWIGASTDVRFGKSYVGSCDLDGMDIPWKVGCNGNGTAACTVTAVWP